MKILSLIAAMLSLTVALSCSRPADPAPTQQAPQNTDYGTPMASPPTVDDMVMYEVNLRAFSREGTIAAVTARLDTIKKMGVNVIWLMPIFRQGSLRSVGSPYAVQNYFEVSPEYGTLQDLRNLTDAAHAKGIAIILDWVANHTSWDNPWIVNTSWYTQVNGTIVHPPGTNWQDVADLNYGNMAMRLEMINAMRYWVKEANIDGYRCDAADYVEFPHWKQINDSLRKLPGRRLIMLAEGGRADHLAAGFDLNFGWAYHSAMSGSFRSGQPASNMFTTHQREMGAMSASKSQLRFTTNHDESAWDNTPPVLYGGLDGSFAAAAVTYYSGGVPLVYSSQEVGRTTTVPFFSRSPIDWTANPALKRDYENLLQVYRSNAKWRQRQYTDLSSTTVWAVEKSTGTEKGYVFANTRNSQQVLNLSQAGLDTLPIRFVRGTYRWQGNDLILGPYAVLVVG